MAETSTHHQEPAHDPIAPAPAAQAPKQALDPRLLEAIDTLDGYCKTGGDSVGVLVRLEGDVSAIRGLPDEDLMLLLARVKNENALALLLLLIGRLDADRAHRVLASLEKHPSAIVRIASYYGRVIEPTDGEPSASLSQFWTEMLGSVLLLAQAPLEQQTEFVAHIRKVEDPEVLRELTNAMASGSEPMVRNLVAKLLEPSREHDCVLKAYLSALSHDESSVVRQTVAKSLAGFQNPVARGALRQAIESDTDAQVRTAAVASLGEGADEEVSTFFISWFPKARTVEEQRAVVTSVGQVSSPISTRFLVTLLEGRNEIAVRSDALNALASFKDEASALAVRRALGSPDVFIRILAAKKLGDMGNRDAVDDLEHAAADDPDPVVRKVAKASLKKLGR